MPKGPAHDDLSGALSRITELLEVAVKAHLAPLNEKYVSSPQLRTLFENTGDATTTELVKKTGFSAGKISGIWKKWESVGLLRREGSRYRRVV